MTYTIEIIPAEKQSIGTWSGGTTTELAIYPPGSAYKERNFIWRLSSAVVDIEESTFTSLPGVWRHIMVLEGEMELRHEGHHNILLKPYDKDSFSGSWTTRSIGKVRDFNLMLTQGCEGALEAIIVGMNESVERVIGPMKTGFMNCTEAYYCADGEIQIIIGQEETLYIHRGDLALLSCQNSGSNGEVTLRIIGKTDAAVITAEISY